MPSHQTVVSREGRDSHLGKPGRIALTPWLKALHSWMGSIYKLIDGNSHPAFSLPIPSFIQFSFFCDYACICVSSMFCSVFFWYSSASWLAVFCNLYVSLWAHAYWLFCSGVCSCVAVSLSVLERHTSQVHRVAMCFRICIVLVAYPCSERVLCLCSCPSLNSSHITQSYGQATFSFRDFSPIQTLPYTVA